MYRLVAFFVMGLITISTTYANGDTTVRYKEGSTAMLFTLNGLGNLGADNYQGGIGANHYISNDIALRVGLGFGLNSSTVSQNDGTGEEVSKSSTIPVSPGIRFNLAHNRNIVMYTGGMVNLGLTNGSSTVDGSETSSSSSTEIGAGVFAGAEFFPWENVALGLEYLLGFSTSSGSTTTGGVESNLPSNTDIELSLSTLQFTLSFYFN